VGASSWYPFKWFAKVELPPVKVPEFLKQLGRPDSDPQVIALGVQGLQHGPKWWRPGRSKHFVSFFGLNENDIGDRDFEFPASIYLMIVFDEGPAPVVYVEWYEG
jgi:hypothetical protein